MQKLSNQAVITPKSLLKEVESQEQFSVWFSDQNGKLIKIELQSGSVTVGDAIKESIYKINRKYKFNLNEDASCYELYGAKKNGKKKSDFPSLEYEQFIQNTKLVRFHLFPLFPFTRKHSEQTTIASLQSLMEIDYRSSPKKQIKTKKGIGCFFCH